MSVYEPDAVVPPFGTVPVNLTMPPLPSDMENDTVLVVVPLIVPASGPPSLLYPKITLPYWLRTRVLGPASLPIEDVGIAFQLPVIPAGVLFDAPQVPARAQ